MTTDTKAVARWTVGNKWESSNPDGRWVLFTEHEQVVAELEAEVTRFSKFYAEAIEQIAEIATERQAALSALAAKSAEVEGLRLVVNRARHLAAWFSSGNTVPVHGTHVMKISGTSVMDDVYQLNQALDAMEKSNEHQVEPVAPKPPQRPVIDVDWSRDDDRGWRGDADSFGTLDGRLE